MTFEEFKRLALNPTYNYEQSVYRVDVFRIQGTDKPRENLQKFGHGVWRMATSRSSRVDPPSLYSRCEQARRPIPSRHHRYYLRCPLPSIVLTVSSIGRVRRMSIGANSI